MNSLAELIVLGFAVWEAIEIWRHADVPFIATGRAYVETWDGFFGQVLRCPFCLAPWAAITLWLSASEIAYCLASAVCLLALVFGKHTKVTGWILALTMILIALLNVGFRRYDVHLLVLAAARLANVGNDLTHAWCRTPGRPVAISRSEPYVDFVPADHPPSADPDADLRPGDHPEAAGSPCPAVPGASGAGGSGDGHIMAGPPE